MAQLGSPVTNKFSIGTAEFRVGALSDANKLTQTNSVGLIDSATLEVTQNSVDLVGGFPQVIVDTAIVSQEATITATLREYSRKNLNLMLGEGFVAGTTDVSSNVVNDTVAGATSIIVTTGDAALFAAGDLVGVYPAARPEELQLLRVSSVDTTTDTLTLDVGTPTIFDINGTTETVVIYKAQPLPVGAITATNYFSCQLVQKNRDGRPVTYTFWKAAIGAGMSLSTSASDFASTDLNVKLLQPSASEYATGGPLAHLANIIPSNPTGLIAVGGDTA